MSTTSTDRNAGLVTGVAIKAPCVAATTANITLSGEQTIDGRAVVSGNRVLVKNQTSSVNNGIYVCDTGSWSRDVDFDGARDAVTGTQVIILYGTVSAGRTYRVTTATPFVIGTDAITFTVVSLDAAADAATAAAAAAAALVSQTAAAASATLAAAALTTTSTTSNSIATGAKTFTVDSGKNFVAGQFIQAVDAASSASMWGQVTSYSGTTLIIDSQAVVGSGTKTSWNISVSGSRGASGGGSGDMLAATYDAAGIAAQVAGTTASQTLTNKSLQDSTTFIVDNGDATKKLAFQCSGISTLTTRTVTIPDKSGTMAMTSDITTSNSSQTSPSNPTGTSNATGLMMGLAGALTTASGGSGTVLVIITGIMAQNGPVGTIGLQAYYGTGAAPANGDAITGTAIASRKNPNPSSQSGNYLPFICIGKISGLASATAYWLDIAISNNNANTSTIKDVDIIAIEYK